MVLLLCFTRNIHCTARRFKNIGTSYQSTYFKNNDNSSSCHCLCSNASTPDSIMVQLLIMSTTLIFSSYFKYFKSNSLLPHTTSNVQLIEGSYLASYILYHKVDNIFCIIQIGHG